MIIWGSRGITSTVEEGRFHCPRCGPQRTFYVKQVKRWFTLYFIPIFPMYSAGEYLECQNCTGTFGTETRSYDPAAAHQQTCDEIKRILILTALAQGPLTDATRDALIAVYADLADVFLQRSEIDREITFARAANARLTPYVQSTASQYTLKGKHMIMSSAYAVLCPNGGLTASADAVLRELGAALSLSPSDVQTFLASGRYPSQSRSP